jgi:ABC-2 type transport system permease protein
MIDAIASEWVKLRSLRSTYTVLAASASGVAVSAYVAFAISTHWDREGSGGDTVGTGLEYGAPVGYILFGLLGVLAIAPEYGTGMIRLSLTVVRRRPTLLLAKAAVVAAVATVAGTGLTFAMYGVSQAVVGDRPIGAGLTEPTVVPELFATGTGMATAALLGLGLGAVLRSTSSAIVALLTILLAPPQLARFLPAPWDVGLESVTLPTLTRELAGVPNAGALGPPAALATVGGYVVVSLGVALITITRRDA